MKIGIIGFGEAGHMFGKHLAKRAQIHAFDLKQDAAIKSKAQKAGVMLHGRLEQAVEDAEFVLSLVTADQADIVARAAAPHLRVGQYFLEMNSVAPGTKQANAALCTALVDVAIMAPVYPKQADVPLLLSHPDGQNIAERLANLGLNIRHVGPDIGRAAAIKMCRSVMIKGMEALTLESMLTARHYGVEDDVKSSLAKSFPGMGWSEDRVDYWFERVSRHGKRRAAEMREVAKTVGDARVASEMSSETARTHDLYAGHDFSREILNFTDR